VLFRMLTSLFRGETPDEAQARGAANARTFPDGNPTGDEIGRYLSSACEDEAFGFDGGAYARGVRTALRAGLPVHSR